MSCLSEEQVIEILDRGGLESAAADERAHLESCAACRESWATAAAAGELLTEARPAASRWRIFPVAVAAAMLLAIIGAIAIRPTPPKRVDPVVLLTEGSPEESNEARAMLLKAGRSSLPALAAARGRFKGTPKLRILQDLMFEIKLQDPEGRELLQQLDTRRIDLQFTDTPIDDVIGFLRDFAKINIVLDPLVERGALQTLNLKNATHREVLDMICLVMELDFDVRYGVLFLSKPLRLWSTDPKVGLPAANSLAAGPVAEKLRAIRITIEMEGMPLNAIADYLQEISGIPVKSEGLPERTLALKVSDLPLHHALELLSLPYGWDARVDGGSVVIFARK